MAGTDSRFDAAAFRTAIRFAMNMGLPDATEQRATFKWNTERTFGASDASGNPWSWTQTAATTVTYDDIQIPVAVEYRAGPAAAERLGDLEASKAVLTILDEDFADLTADRPFPNQVQLGSSLFDIQFVEPPTGLFDVTIYSIHCESVDEGV